MKKVKKIVILLGIIFSLVLASCQKEICTVTFEYENGDYIKSIEVYSGDKISQPESVEEYEGYTFAGWYLEGEKYSFNSRVESNITLVAKYTANQYMLSFGENVEPIKVIYGQPIGQLPALPEVEGKADGVWTLDGVILTSKSIYNFTEDKVAVADYGEATYKVSFVSEEQETKYVIHGSKVNEPKTPIKDGYDFAGWYLEGAIFDFNTKIEEDIILEAHWSPKNNTSYTVNVYAEVDGEYIDITKNYTQFSGLVGKTESTVNISMIANNNVPTDYVLNNEKSILEGTIVGDGSLVLSIYYDIVRYKVSFNVPGVEEQYVIKGSTAVYPGTPEKNGYVFHSWILGENEFDFSTEITSDINLTAGWLVAKDHVITFDSLNGEVIKAQSLANGKKIVKPADLDKEGYNFDGWYLDGEKWNFNEPLSTTHAKEIKLVAKWIASKYELSFDENSNNKIVVTYDQPIGELPELKELSPNKTGNWKIEDIVIDENTVWKYTSNMEAKSQYYVNMLSSTIDLSTRGELDLNEQLINVLGLSDVVVNQVTENGNKIAKSFLSDIEDNATDEASRTKVIVANIGNTEYILKVFFATKVIYTYEELTKIQEYGGLEKTKFPGDLNYTMYGYSGYFILGNDIDASPSMTKTYKIGTMGRYDSQVWDTEMTGFNGVFDGRGHTIDKLYTAAGGLLGDVLKGAVIKNLAITNAKIVEGNTGAGILCYIFSYATAENIYVDFTTSAGNSGLFGRMNKAGTIRNVVVKYNNTGVSGGVISSWQVQTTNTPYPVFENVSFIYEKGTAASKMKIIGNSTYSSENIKEYILQEDGSLLAINVKMSSGTEFTSYTTKTLIGNEFEKYDQKYWDLSGSYPTFK